MEQYQEVIHKSRYARFRDELGRREHWNETVWRLVNYWKEKFPELIKGEVMDELYQTVHDLGVMPSMRSMMTAGKALDRDNVAGYNCSYVAVDHPRVFDEIMYILMCGTGVGFSVERNEICHLPEVAEEMHKTDTSIVVSDSKIGWSSAFRELVSLLYAGKIPSWDLSKIRPAGERLKTFGGRASGPEPLDRLFHFTVELFKGATGRKLNSVECHDLVCKVAEIVVVGGVRRSALISLSNLTDDRMRRAKSGQWWNDNPQRALANNSVAYTEKPDFDSFLKEVWSLYESKSGERGIFSRPAAQKIAGRNGRRDPNHSFGTNPCSEIILRSAQFCNLSEVVIRADDNYDDIKRKVRLATILGTLQATRTNFRYLRAIWKKNTEEENLLGVSFTGIMDHPVMSGREPIFKHKGKNIALSQALSDFKKEAVEVNEEWSRKLGINQSTAITCVKPSGTVSQLVNSASGIHPRFARHYVRTIRGDKKDPLSQFLVDSGVPAEEDVMSPTNWVFSFPVEAPAASKTVEEVGPMDQLKLWELYQDNWCEHKPSITVYYTQDTFLKVMSWVWDKFNKVSGISFLPQSEHTYQQAPYQEVDKAEFDRRVKEMPELDWELMGNYEKEDNTIASQELACTGNACEVP